MKCPQFILEIINRYEYPEVDHFEWKLFLKGLYRMFRGARPIFAIRMFFQKVFRKNHLCDLHIWDTTSYMARECLKRLRAFKEYERHGYPSDFCASHTDYSCSNPNNPEYELTIDYSNYELLRYAESCVSSGLINMAVYWQNLWD